MFVVVIVSSFNGFYERMGSLVPDTQLLAYFAGAIVLFAGTVWELVRSERKKLTPLLDKSMNLRSQLKDELKVLPRKQTAGAFSFRRSSRGVPFAVCCVFTNATSAGAIYADEASFQIAVGGSLQLINLDASPLGLHPSGYTVQSAGNAFGAAFGSGAPRFSTPLKFTRLQRDRVALLQPSRCSAGGRQLSSGLPHPAQAKLPRPPQPRTGTQRPPLFCPSFPLQPGACG